MARSAARWIGLAAIGAAAVACWRAWRRRTDLDHTDDQAPADDSPAPSLVVVPEPAPAAEPVSADDATSTQTTGGDPAEPAPAVPPAAAEVVDAVDPTGEPADPAATTTAGRRWAEPVDGACPDGYPVKVNERSGIYHVPDGLSYERTRPTRCYASAGDAEADGFRRAKR